MEAYINVSLGELVDRITILQIKYENIKQTSKHIRIRQQLHKLQVIYNKLQNQDIDNEINQPTWYSIDQFKSALRAINERIWVANEILHGDDLDDSKWVEYGKVLVNENDKRAYVKRLIDDLAGSNPGEEKSYDHE